MKKTIVLFSPRSHPDEYSGYTPIQLLSLASLIHKKYDVKITYDIPNVNYHKKVLDLCDGALCLGISAMSGYQIKDALKLCRMVKKKHPSLPIIWGGYHPTILPKQTLESYCVDMVVVGHGRIAFKKLVEAIDQKKSLEDIKGIGYKKSGHLYFNKRGKFEDPNNFPEIPYHLIKGRLKNQKIAEYISSFGCPYNCGFCAENVMSQRRWKGLKAERVVKEIEKLVREFNIKEIRMVDSNFFADKKRAIDICKGLIKRKLNVKWGSVGGRVDMLINFSNEEWTLLKESGCNLILIGAESGVQEDLDLINKKITVNQTKEVIRLASKHKIPLNLSCLVGLPSMNLNKSLRKTIDLLDYSIKTTQDNVLQILLYTPYPGSPLYDLSKRHGFKEPESLEKWSTFELNTKNTSWVSKEEASRIEMIHRWYIIPFLTGIYKGVVPRPIYDIYYNLAKFRWDNRFFSFPIEYQPIKLVKSYLKWKRGFNE